VIMSITNESLTVVAPQSTITSPGLLYNPPDDLVNKATSKVQLSDRKETKWSRKELEGRIVLFFVENMQQLANEIVARSNGKILLGEIHWLRFSDDFPNLKIGNADALKWADCAFLASFHSPEVIFEQLALIYAIPRYFAKSLTIYLPYFPTGTMERVQEYGEIATAATLARMLSMVPSCARGPTQIHTLDIHTLHNQFYFRDSVLIGLYTCIDLLRNRIALLPDASIVSIAFPDEGAYKRFSNKFTDYPVIICHKIRDGDNRNVKVKEGQVKGRHVIIVDDLVQSGSTLIQCALALRQFGADKVSGYVSHAIFPNNSWQKFLHSDKDKGMGGFDYFWVTNSHPTSNQLQGKKPFEVLSIASLICDDLSNKI